jgi:hypothetical protein
MRTDYGVGFDNPFDVLSRMRYRSNLYQVSCSCVSYSKYQLPADTSRSLHCERGCEAILGLEAIKHTDTTSNLETPNSKLQTFINLSITVKKALASIHKND